MATISYLLPLVLSVLLIGCFVKIAALVLRRMVISWKSAFLFALLWFVLGIVKTLFGAQLVLALPPAVAILLGFGISLAIGSWFFASRATTAEGSKIGWLGGFKLTALSFILMLVVSIPIMLVMRSPLPLP